MSKVMNGLSFITLCETLSGLASPNFNNPVRPHIQSVVDCAFSFVIVLVV